jgi:hypothetical protein
MTFFRDNVKLLPRYTGNYDEIWLGWIQIFPRENSRGESKSFLLNSINKFQKKGEWSWAYVHG